jgi:DNA-binding GntR family transcriptional regulator
MTLDEQAGGSLRTRVLDRLRSGIVSGRSAPGTIFSVPSLASELGMSSTPVREALLELARDGLVTPLRNRGFRVESMTIADLDNLFAIRELLETYALQTVARSRITETEELRRRADDVAKAVDAQDVPAYVTTDRAFHAALVARANNPRLSRLVLSLRDDMRLYGIDSAKGRARQVASVGEHYEMIDVATRGDVARAAPLMHQHIMSWKPLFVAALGQSA